MGEAAFSLDVKFTTITCGECGGIYALGTRFVEQKRAKSGWWTCPYCKCGWGYGESADEKKIKALEDRLRWAEKGRESARRQAEQEAARAAGYKGQLTKVKRRIAAGVCPSCKRSFQNLRRHIETKHPDYAPPPEVQPRRCGSTETASGEPCTRVVAGSTPHCWQHT